MTQPDIFVLIGDCLRASSVDQRTMPFSITSSEATFERCYAPSTWTLPSHASLYSRKTPVEHDVTRRGEGVSKNQATLPKIAREEGYRTALFSENPTFSAHFGFHHNIDYVDDFINSKLFSSDFALEHAVDEITADNALEALRALASHPNRARNIPNALYGPISYAASKSKTRYPHHGDRVFSHLDSYTENTSSEPVLCAVNLLDTHNPHNAPPKAGEKGVGISVSSRERKALSALKDNKIYLFKEPDSPPTDSQDVYHSWDDVFARKRDVYDAQIRYLDIQIERWITGLDEEAVRDSLFVITGDHGQLFGEEEMVGHHTSLHPAGVHVPLFVRFPDSWEGGRTSVTEPVSWLGLSKAIERTTTGEITSSDEFVQCVQTESTTDGAVIMTADGPTWNVSKLRERYDSPMIDELATRKVGVIDGDRQIVYESKWADEEITRRDYELVDGGREEIEGGSTVDLSPEQEQWLVRKSEGDVDASVSARLEQLGYL
ncbi:sulfatase-like hydrolase/transferase [Halalkalicoccus sp. NIPERK01]|uniref:sulfatase-like hydrolase/transferase n=1 Tax=Halalkalicoccus sp. NIPERK01 TaxID=3053469 RepID=UPI00256EBC14|nr:sulfatase-like hydrolase/transferase [Halalkalicoccus sp. NIPERK01]MDL5363425.1 sulfatase-like hydrolase/transferase [Halalkalicoccus sp. NIPERK01]